jgi:octaprenyl-diphosphate synthase
LGKNIGDDLIEGKPTLPLIYALETADAAHVQLIRQAIEHDDRGPLEPIVAAIRNSGAMERTRACATQHAQAARDALTALPASPQRDALAVLADYSVQRKH